MEQEVRETEDKGQETGNGEQVFTLRSPTSIATSTQSFFYYHLFPFEIPIIKPLLIELYRTIGFKQGVENPDPKLADIIKTHMQNPYHHIWVAFNYEPKFPFQMTDVPAGYIWFYISMDVYGDNYLKFEHLYIDKNFNKHLSILKQLCKIGFSFGKRSSVKNIFADASTRRMQEHWHSFGFKDMHVCTCFEGSVEELEKIRLNKIYGEDKLNAKLTETEPNISTSTY